MRTKYTCVCLIVLASACASDAPADDSPAVVYAPTAGAGGASQQHECPEPVECPPAPAPRECPEPVECPPARECAACPAVPNLATEYALRAPFCRTQDGKEWGCATFEGPSAPAGNVTYSAGGVAWSCVLRSPDPTAPNGLGWGPRYTAPLPCGAGNACDVTVVTSGGVEHRSGVCQSQRELNIAQ